MSLQAPLLKYSPCHQPTTSYQIIIMVYSAYILYKYTSRTKYTLIAWEQTPLICWERNTYNGAENNLGKA